jgi:putative endonuclease
MSNRRQALGREGEDIAVSFLSRNGYIVLTRNYRCHHGEIDIIARQKDVLVFIEVKTRTSLSFDSPAAAVTLKKQQQISRTAQYYLATAHLFDTPARFDVVSILISPNQPPVVEVIPNAFDLC